MHCPYVTVHFLRCNCVYCGLCAPCVPQEKKLKKAPPDLSSPHLLSHLLPRVVVPQEKKLKAAFPDRWPKTPDQVAAEVYGKWKRGEMKPKSLYRCGEDAKTPHIHTYTLHTEHDVRRGPGVLQCWATRSHT